MKSTRFNRKSRIQGITLPRTVSTNNDPDFNAVIKKMSNKEYRHFVSFALLSNVPESQRSKDLSLRWSTFRENMIKKYAVN